MEKPLLGIHQFMYNLILTNTDHCKCIGGTNFKLEANSYNISHQVNLWLFFSFFLFNLLPRGTIARNIEFSIHNSGHFRHTGIETSLDSQIPKF